MRQPWLLRDNKDGVNVDDNVNAEAESKEDPLQGDRARPVNCSVMARNYPSMARPIL
jgi:hypothetical protein